MGDDGWEKEMKARVALYRQEGGERNEAADDYAAWEQC